MTLPCAVDTSLQLLATARSDLRVKSARSGHDIRLLEEAEGAREPRDKMVFWSVRNHEVVFGGTAGKLAGCRAGDELLSSWVLLTSSREKQTRCCWCTKLPSVSIASSYNEVWLLVVSLSGSGDSGELQVSGKRAAVEEHVWSSPRSSQDCSLRNTYGVELCIGLSDCSWENALVMRICGERRWVGGVCARDGDRKLRGANNTRWTSKQAALALGRSRGGETLRFCAGVSGIAVSATWILGCCKVGNASSKPGTWNQNKYYLI